MPIFGNETPFLFWKHWTVRRKLVAGDENVQFWPQNLDILGQKSIFCFGFAIFVNREYHQYTRGYNFPILTTPNKFSVSELYVIFWGSSQFLAISGYSHFAIISTLNFEPLSTKLGGTALGPSKRWPTMTTDPVQKGITEKRSFLRLAGKCFLVLFSLHNFTWSWPELG